VSLRIQRTKDLFVLYTYPHSKTINAIGSTNGVATGNLGNKDQNIENTDLIPKRCTFVW
jgi:hypothetical protein